MTLLKEERDDGRTWVGQPTASDGYDYTLAPRHNPATDRAYAEEHEVEKKLGLALAWLVREKPEFPLRRLAELLSPETYLPPSGDERSALGHRPSVTRSSRG